ncbi:hypothetical protein ACFWUW_15845 [Streptomyces sp. NPDC058655]|uniref:hypothetical protein n=1 Tax=Streptomyces sp. NPDC058655 TaxID=3346577 RepID=UPI003646980B
MTNELIYADPCPLCGRPLTLRPTVEVRSNTPYPTRIDRLPHCTSCAGDMTRAQQWADMMRHLYES